MGSIPEAFLFSPGIIQDLDGASLVIRNIFVEFSKTHFFQTFLKLLVAGVMDAAMVKILVKMEMDIIISGKDWHSL